MGWLYLLLISNDVTAIYVSTDEEEAQKIQAKWATWGAGVRLVIIQSTFRLLIEPLMEYIKAVYQFHQPNEIFVVVMPQFVSNRWWTNLLHSQTAFLLRMALLSYPGIVIIEVPYHID